MSKHEYWLTGMEAQGDARNPEAPWRVEDVMAWTGMSRRSVLDFARQGVLPAKKIGGTWFFSRAKLADFFGVSED